MDLFDTILSAGKPSTDIDSTQWGIVASNDDPLKLGRVQIYDQAKGGKYKSDWLFRALPFTSFTPPVPNEGDLVSFGYINGNPHQGVYFGVIVNNVNQAVGKDDEFTIVLGGAKVRISPNGDVEVTGAKKVKLEGTEVTIKSSSILKLEAATLMLNATSGMEWNTPTTLMSQSGMLTLNSKPVMVVGGTDSRGDTMVNSGQ